MDVGDSLTVFVTALCAPELLPTDTAKHGAEAVVSGACGGDDGRSGTGTALMLKSASAKCAAPGRAGSRVAPDGGCSPAAASPGSLKVGHSQLSDGSQVNII